MARNLKNGEKAKMNTRKNGFESVLIYKYSMKYLINWTLLQIICLFDLLHKRDKHIMVINCYIYVLIVLLISSFIWIEQAEKLGAI